MSEAQSRIIQHMNRDHQLALIDYLSVYGSIATNTINSRSVRISDIDTEKIQINYVDNKSTPKLITIYLNNALEDDNVKVEKLTDLRAKLVSMAIYCANKQGYSHKQITSVTYPCGPGSYFLYLIFFTSIYASVKPKDFIKRVGPLAVKILNLVPDFASPAVSKILTFLIKYGATIIKAMYLAHIVEIFAFMLRKTKKYRVPTPQRLQWIFFNFVEGFYALKRFNKLARAKEEEF